MELIQEKNIVREANNDPIGLLSDPKKITVLKNFVSEMGISENTLHSGRVKFLQRGKEYFIGMHNDSGGNATINLFSQNNIGGK